MGPSELNKAMVPYLEDFGVRIDGYLRDVSSTWLSLNFKEEGLKTLSQHPYAAFNTILCSLIAFQTKGVYLLNSKDPLLAVLICWSQMHKHLGDE